MYILPILASFDLNTSNTTRLCSTNIPYQIISDHNNLKTHHMNLQYSVLVFDSLKNDLKKIRKRLFRALAWFSTLLEQRTQFFYTAYINVYATLSSVHNSCYSLHVLIVTLSIVSHTEQVGMGGEILYICIHVKRASRFTRKYNEETRFSC